jgi:hypothetical protein
MQRICRQEDLNDKRRRSVVFQIASSPSSNVFPVVIGLIEFDIEPLVDSLDISVGLGVGRGEVDSRMEDDEGGLGVEVLNDLVESLHLGSRVVLRLVLSVVPKLFGRGRALGKGRVGSEGLDISISGVVGACGVGLFVGGRRGRDRRVTRELVLMHGCRESSNGQGWWE